MNNPGESAIQTVCERLRQRWKVLKDKRDEGLLPVFEQDNGLVKKRRKKKKGGS